MNKSAKLTIPSLMLLFAIIILALYSLDLNQELIIKDKIISDSNNQIFELQNQQYLLRKPYLVTPLGVSTQPRNNTPYPHPHFTVEGYVFNIGNRTAYSARLDVTAFYTNGYSALNVSIPLGDLQRYAVVEVRRIIATEDWIGNYSIIPVYVDNP